MPDLLVPPFTTAAAVLDVQDPVDRTAPLNRGLLNWHLVLPHALGGVTWRNLVTPRHATLIAMEPRSATLGWNATRRQGGLGEVRLHGVDGTAASVASSSVYDFLNTTFTVSCWMRATVAAQANLVARRLIGAAEGSWFFRMDAGGTLTARLGDSTGVNTIAGRTSVSTTLANGQWHHLLVVFTTHTTTVASNTVTLYVNGRLDQGTLSSTGATAYSAPTQPVTFGALASLAAPLNGALDDIRIYTRGLSATEALQLYQASRTGYRRELRWLPPPQVWLVPPAGTVVSLTAAVSGVSTTPAAVASVLTPLTAPPNAQQGYTFPATTQVRLPGAAHGIGHAALLVGLYDASTPRQLLTPGAVTVDATTYDVEVTFGQPQAGLLVLSGGTPPDGPTGNYTQALSVAAGGTVTIPGATHGLGHAHLLVAVYDASTPRVRLTPGRVTVHPSTFTVEITFAQAATGLIVLAGYTGTGGTANRTVSLPGSSPVSIPQATHGLTTQALLLEVYDTSTPRRRVTPGQVTVHPTTHEVVLTFAQGQLGTVVLNGSSVLHVVELVAAPVGTSTTPATLLQTGRSVVGHPQGMSLASTISANVQRQLTAAPQDSSTTPSLLVQSARLVAAHPQGASTTAAAVLAMGRPLLAHSQGSSTTPAALAGLLRGVTAHPSTASTTPAIGPTTARLLTAHPQAASTTPTAQGLAQSPTRLVGVDFSLGAPGIVTIPAATHGLATAALLVQVWDAQTPRHKLTPGRITVDPSTFTVEVHLAQAQSGRVVLAGAHPPTPQEGHYRLAFAPTTLLSVPASLHGFATADLLVAFTDAQAVPQAIEPGSVTLHPSTYELIATFAQPQGGTVVLVGSAAASALPHYTQAFGPAPSVTFDGDAVGLATTHLLLQIWDTQTPRQQVQPGRVTMDPSSHVVTVTFAQDQAGTLVATGLARLGLWLAHPVATSTTPSAVVQTVHLVAAHPQGSSTTPVALGALVRSLTAHPQGSSTTPLSARQLTRALQAHPQGASVTQAATVQTAALVSFLAHPAGGSTTPATLQILGRQLSTAVQGTSTTPLAVSTLLRQLSVHPQGTSTTPGALAQLAALRQILAHPQGASTTPLSGVRVGRALAAHPQGVALTPPAVPQMASQVLLTAGVQGTSATPAVVQTVTRSVTAHAHGTSTTPAALARTQRSLIAAVGGSSSTSVSIIQLPGQIQLQAAAAGSSTTPPAVVRTGRRLVAAPLGTSLTPVAVSLLTRRVLAHPQGASTTPVALRQLVRGLLAHPQGVSLTPAVVRLLVRRVIAHSQASSTTSSAIVLLTRRVLAQAQGSSTTPVATALVSTLVPLAAHAQTVSTTPPAGQQLTRGLVAHPSAASTTPPSPLHTERLLSAYPQSSSTTPAAVGALLRPLVSVVVGESSTPVITQALSRGLASTIQGTTQSTAIRVVSERPLDAHPQGLSVAPPALLIPFSGEFQLVAAVQGTSTSTDAAAILLSMPRVTQVHRLPRVTRVVPRPRVTTVPASVPVVTD